MVEENVSLKWKSGKIFTLQIYTRSHTYTRDTVFLFHKHDLFRGKGDTFLYTTCRPFFWWWTEFSVWWLIRFISLITFRNHVMLCNSSRNSILAREASKARVSCIVFWWKKKRIREWPANVWSIKNWKKVIIVEWKTGALKKFSHFFLFVTTFNDERISLVHCTKMKNERRRKMCVCVKVNCGWLQWKKIGLRFKRGTCDD